MDSSTEKQEGPRAPEECCEPKVVNWSQSGHDERKPSLGGVLAKQRPQTEKRVYEKRAKEKGRLSAKRTYISDSVAVTAIRRDMVVPTCENIHSLEAPIVHYGLGCG